MAYTGEQILAAWERVKYEEDPLSELEGVLSEVYRKVGESTEAVEATLAFMFDKEDGPYTVETIRAFAGRYQIAYKDHKELAENELDSLIGDEIRAFLTYIDLDRLGADLVNDDQDRYFEHGGQIHYFGSPA